MSRHPRTPASRPTGVDATLAVLLIGAYQIWNLVKLRTSAPALLVATGGRHREWTPMPQQDNTAPSMRRVCVADGCSELGELRESQSGWPYRVSWCAAHRNVQRALTRKLTADGYAYIKVDGKWVAEHRHVMEQVLGRPLRPGESPHHKNGVRDDNRPENLELWVGATRHGQRATDIICPCCGCQYFAAITRKGPNPHIPQPRRRKTLSVGFQLRFSFGDNDESPS